MKAKSLYPATASEAQPSWYRAALLRARHLTLAALAALFEPWFFRGSQLAERRRGPFSFVPRRPRRRWR